MLVSLCLQSLFLLQPGPSSGNDLGLVVVSAKPALELNALFEGRDGWIGADGAYSVPLSSGRSLWLFSDTWVGKVQEGKRADATIVNNTAAIFEGPGARAAAQFFIQRDRKGKPTALLTPSHGSGWFWPQAAALHKGKLYLFLTQVEKTTESSVFGFRLTGQSLAIVNNPFDPPTQWHVEQLRIPYAKFSPKRELTFGAALLSEGEFLYIYGIADESQAAFRKKSLVVARVPWSAVADFAAWRFYHEGRWSADCSKADRLADTLANECSVSYVPGLKRYVLVYTEGGLSPRILARTAAKPWRPLSVPAVLYQCP